MEGITRRGVLAAGAGAAAIAAYAAAQVTRQTQAQESTKEVTMGAEIKFDYEFNGVKTASVEVERDGLVLRGRLEAPTDVLENGAPVAIFMHGARGNSTSSDLYNNLCLAMAARGYAMIRFDFDGHGNSDGEFDGSSVLTELDDLASIVEYVESLPWAKGVYAIGHSQGGCVGTMYAGQHPDAFKAVAVVDPAVNIHDNCESGALDGKASDAYIAAGKDIDIFGTVAGYEGPVCVIHGLADTVVLPEYAQRLADAYGQDIELHLLAGAAHTPVTHAGIILEIIDAFFRQCN